MPHIRTLIIGMFLIVLSSCSDDGDSSSESIHYEWPIWSQNGSTVAAMYNINSYSGISLGRMEFAIRNVQTDKETFITTQLSSTSHPLVYRFAKDSLFFLVGTNGLNVLDVDGSVLHTTIGGGLSYYPIDIAFSKFSKSYYWYHVNSSETGRIVIGHTMGYHFQTLNPSNPVILLDTLSQGYPLDIIETRKNECAVLLSNGKILLIGTDGVTKKVYSTEKLSIYTNGNSRLRYMKSVLDSATMSKPDFLYYLDKAGIGRINLVTGDISTVLSADEGNIETFDTDGNFRNILFVTSSREVWLASENGVPIQILLYDHSMGSLSPDGKSVAAVKYINGKHDSLTILRFRK